MNATIRIAKAADMPTVLQLIQELANFENEPDAVSITTETLVQFGTGKNPLFTCFVAENESVIIGIALIYHRFSTWKGKSLHLEDLVVTESYRNKGVGSLLYNAVMKFAKTHDIPRVSWEVLDWNTNAITFYENTGAHILKDWRIIHFEKQQIDSYLANTD